MNGKAALGAVGAVLGIGAAGFWLLSRDMSACDADESVIAVSSEGQKAYLRRDSCDGVASSDVASIVLVDRDGRRATPFRFDTTTTNTTPEQAAKRTRKTTPHQLDIY